MWAVVRDELDVPAVTRTDSAGIINHRAGGERRVAAVRTDELDAPYVVVFALER